MIGVILAAGKATRLPDKPLLPRPQGGMLIDESYGFLSRSGCSRIRVVVSKDSVLPLILQRHWKGALLPVSFVEQEAAGVQGAITAGVSFDEDNLIAFCDNWYGDEVAPLRLPDMPVASARLTQSGGLTARRDDKWVRVAPEDGANELCFAGWMYLPAWTTLPYLEYDTFETWMNVLFVKPLIVPRGTWRDAGTHSSYKELWT